MSQSVSDQAENVEIISFELARQSNLSDCNHLSVLKHIELEHGSMKDFVTSHSFDRIDTLVIAWIRCVTAELQVWNRETDIFSQDVQVSLIQEWDEIRAFNCEDSYEDCQVVSLCDSIEFLDMDANPYLLGNELFQFDSNSELLNGNWISFNTLSEILAMIAGDGAAGEMFEPILALLMRFRMNFDTIQTQKLRFNEETYRLPLINRLKYSLNSDAFENVGLRDIHVWYHEIDAVSLVLKDLSDEYFILGGQAIIVHPNHVNPNESGFCTWSPLGRSKKYFLLGNLNMFEIHIRILDQDDELCKYPVHKKFLLKLWQRMIRNGGQDAPLQSDLDMNNRTKSLVINFRVLRTGIHQILVGMKELSKFTIEVSFSHFGGKSTIDEAVKSTLSIFDLNYFHVNLDLVSVVIDKLGGKLLIHHPKTGLLSRMSYPVMGASNFVNVYGTPSFRENSDSWNEVLFNSGGGTVGVEINDQSFDIHHLNLYSTNKSAAVGHHRAISYIVDTDSLTKMSMEGKKSDLKREVDLIAKQFDYIAIGQNAIRHEVTIGVPTELFTIADLNEIAMFLLDKIIHPNLHYARLVDHLTFASRHRAVCTEIIQNPFNPRKIALMSRALMYLLSGSERKWPWSSLESWNGGYPACLPHFGNELAVFKNSPDILEKMAIIETISDSSNHDKQSDALLESLMDYLMKSSTGKMRIDDMTLFVDQSKHMGVETTTFLSWIGGLRTFKSYRWSVFVSGEFSGDFHIRHVITSSWNYHKIMFLPELKTTASIRKDGTRSISINAKKWVKIKF